jgi:dienelactone hydrolase
VRNRDIVCLAILAALSVVEPGLAAPHLLAGDWAGWAYFEGDGGDVPLRLRISGGDVPEVRFDEVARRAYDLPASIVEWTPPRLIIERTRANGQKIRLEGELAGDAIQGRVEWVDARGRFELVRAVEPIARIAPETFADLQGSYRLGADRVLVIGSRFWGELIYTDLATGRQGTLFPLDRDLFYVGGANYVPRPAEAHLRFFRDKDGKPERMEWSAGDGAPISGPHLPIEQEDVRFASGDVELAGTLLRPAGDERRAAAVVLGGSNWAKRDACRRDAEILTSFGLATLIFDRRGNGESPGKAVHSFHDDATDALAAVRFLRGRADVVRDQVGVTGRSQSGWIAPLTATMGEKEVAFLILFVPPAVSPVEQEKTRRTNALADAGFDADTQDLVRRHVDTAADYAETHRGWDEYSTLRARAVAAGIPADELEPVAPDDPDWKWGELNWRYDPVPTLERVKTPTLAIFGAADRNVVPANNLPRMRQALERAGNRDVTLIEVPGANHGLVTLPPGASALPFHRGSAIGNQGWPTVQRWLATRRMAGTVPVEK